MDYWIDGKRATNGINSSIHLSNNPIFAASVPQQLQGLFRKEEIVGANPTGGPIFIFDFDFRFSISQSSDRASERRRLQNVVGRERYPGWTPFLKK